MNPLGIVLGPISAGRGLLGDLGDLANAARHLSRPRADGRSLAESLVERADTLLAVMDSGTALAGRLVEVGENNVELGQRIALAGEASVKMNRETNETLRALDARVREALELFDRLEEAAPPLQSAAGRLERIADRIPGLPD